ncbi:MAG: hypothetical protein U9N52_03680 [Campylobacterota bacterium]|nr:hypothetical protein [Campylobacterota bacterium]
MTPCKELYDLLSDHVIPDVESVLSQMQEYANANDLTPEMHEEQNGLIAIHDNFTEIQDAIESGEIDAKNCEELLKELSLMREMGK